MRKYKLEKWQVIAIVIVTILAVLSFILIWAIMLDDTKGIEIYKQKLPQDPVAQISTSFWAPNPNGVLFFISF